MGKHTKFVTKFELIMVREVKSGKSLYQLGVIMIVGF